jgi:hypothetical protein
VNINTGFYILSFLLMTASPVLLCQERITMPRINGEFRLDGIVDDECWNNIEPLHMVVQTPVFGAEPSEKSEVFICYDNDNLYVGARFFDSDPGKMLIASKKRDEMEVASETMMILIDTFNDKENGLGFATTPSGLRSDFTVSKDGMDQGGGGPDSGPVNVSWNTFWDVRTSRNDQGWFAEMRIPFSSLRFRESNGSVVMGLIVGRYVAHKNELYIFPAIPPNWGESSFIRVSRAQEVVFEGLTSKKPFYIAPYIIGGKQWEMIMNQEGTGYIQDPDDKGYKLNAGLDVKYGLTNNLTLDLTVNTDFAQVEADNEQINLTRFSLFFPEKRTFFQERSSVFSFDFEPQTSLFYSRQIGLNEGEQVPIYGGARITGMAGKWDLGFLEMQTGAIHDLPSENFGILRLRRQLINESSYAGGILTTRAGKNGYNLAYGLDGIFRISENDYLNVKIAGVSDSAANRPFSTDPMRFYINMQRFSQKGFNYEFTWTRSGNGFSPGIGFQTRHDYTHYYGSLGHGWLPGESSSIQNHVLKGAIMAFTDNTDGKAQTIESRIEYEMMLKSGYSGNFSIKRSYENVTDTFEISRESFVPIGKYHFTEIETHINSTPSNRFIMGVDLWAGTFYDGNRVTIGFEPALNIGSSLQLAATYDHNFINFKNRRSFSGGVLGFKALLMMTTRFSMSAFIQYNSAQNGALTNFRLRYNPSEGNDFYLVFNEGRNTYRDVENPRLPVYNIRALLLKYTYTFTL